MTVNRLDNKHYNIDGSLNVVNDDLVNKVVEEVSKTSTEEKQTLSAKVLKAIVDT